MNHRRRSESLRSVSIPSQNEFLTSAAAQTDSMIPTVESMISGPPCCEMAHKMFCIAGTLLRRIVSDCRVVLMSYKSSNLLIKCWWIHANWRYKTIL